MKLTHRPCFCRLPPPAPLDDRGAVEVLRLEGMVSCWSEERQGITLEAQQRTRIKTRQFETTNGTANRSKRAGRTNASNSRHEQNTIKPKMGLIDNLTRCR